jgi:hypothetical protein
MGAITLKHASNCRECYLPLYAGERALWSLDEGVRHINSAFCAAARRVADEAARDVIRAMNRAGEEQGR